jgi:hypothetical protein
VRELAGPRLTSFREFENCPRHAIGHPGRSNICAGRKLYSPIAAFWTVWVRATKQRLTADRVRRLAQRSPRGGGMGAPASPSCRVQPVETYTIARLSFLSAAHWDGAQASPPVSCQPRTFPSQRSFSRLSSLLGPPCVQFSNHALLCRLFQRTASPPPGAWPFPPSHWGAGTLTAGSFDAERSRKASWLLGAQKLRQQSPSTSIHSVPLGQNSTFKFASKFFG